MTGTGGARPVSRVDPMRTCIQVCTSLPEVVRPEPGKTREKNKNMNEDTPIGQCQCLFSYNIERSAKQLGKVA